MQKTDRPSSHAAKPADPPPTRPIEPDAADCCGEDCVPCVFDTYEEALEHYRVALAAWHARRAENP